ncbi:MAG: glycerol-3-phosphate 1-O-acyltransferase PlsB [Halioglobus sp.]
MNDRKSGLRARNGCGYEQAPGVRLRFRSVFQSLRLSWYLFLRAILHIWVRGKVFPEPLQQSGINPDKAVCYLMDTYALSSLLVLDRACESSGLGRPLYGIDGASDLDARAWAALRRLRGILIRRHSSRRSPVMIENLVQHALEHPRFEVQLVPVSILIGRAPDKEKSLTKILFTEGWDVGGRLRRLLGTIINGRDSCVYLGTPLSLRALVDEKSDGGIAARKIYRLARTQLRQTREAAIGPDLSHRRTLIDQIVKGDRVQAAIEAKSKSDNVDVEKLKLEAENSVREIAANYSYAVIRFSDVVLTWIWNKLYDGVKLNHFDDFDVTSSGKTIIYVPCHRSHIDYMLMSYLLYRNGHVPPHIAAGDNLNLPGLGSFLRRAGAFFLRRSFSGDKLYAAVFDEYLSVILARGVSVEYFIEGGRSRTGRLLPPKAGMLQMTVLAYLRAPKKPIVFQPVYIGYERLVEGQSYNSELGGKQKKSESLTDLFGLFGILRRKYGEVHVNFGEPIYLDSLLDAHGPNWKEDTGDKPGWLPGLVEELSTSIMTRINAAADVNPINLLAVCLLAAAKHALPREDLLCQLQLCLNILNSSSTPGKITVTDLSPVEIVDYGKNLGVIEERDHSLGSIVVVAEKSAVLLTYFRNNVAHLFALPSFLASCFLVRRELSRSRVLGLFSFTYTFLKRELFLPWSKKEANEVLEDYIALFVSMGLVSGDRTLKRASGGSQAAASLGLMGRGLLQTFERYFITISVLVAKGSDVLSASELERQCILYAQRISMLHEFDAPEFYDKTLFRQFIANLLDAGFLVESDLGMLQFDETLESIAEGSRLVMSTELRHGILQVASGSAT